jgi:opacity protein-like surface antigen
VLSVLTFSSIATAKEEKTFEVDKYLSSKISFNNFRLWDGEEAYKKVLTGLKIAVGSSFREKNKFYGSRLEAEFGFQGQFKTTETTETDSYTSDISLLVDVSTSFLNYYIDFYSNNSNFKPYLGAGFGYAIVKPSVEYRITGDDFSDKIIMDFNGGSTIGFKFIAGISYNINQSLVIDASYQYVRFQNLHQYLSLDEDHSVFVPFNLRAQELTLGVRYHF